MMSDLLLLIGKIRQGESLAVHRLINAIHFEISNDSHLASFLISDAQMSDESLDIVSAMFDKYLENLRTATEMGKRR